MQKILIITLSFLALIGAGITAYVFLLNKGTVINTHTTQSPDTPVAEEAVATPPTPFQEMRANIEQDNSKNIASYNAAMQAKNPELCDTITEESKKIECHDMIISAEAKKT